MCLKSVVGGEGAEYLVEGGESDNVEFLLPVLDGFFLGLLLLLFCLFP